MNITENDITVNLVLDIPLVDNVVMTTLTAESMQSGNSFESPEAVVPVTDKVTLENEALNIGARSVNVIVMELPHIAHK